MINQDDSQLEFQDDKNKSTNQVEKNKNITCNIFKEQFDLINELPEEERAKVLYLAVYNAFYENEKNQLENKDESQDENQLERAYISISISISNSIYKSLSNISKSVLNLLYKTINCKTYNSNWGGSRKGKKGKKQEEKPKEEPAKPFNPDLYFNIHFQNAFNIYEKNCTNLIPLSYEKRDKDTLTILNTVLESIDYDVEKFTELCQKANDLIKIATTKIDFKMMLRNYIGILQGKYKEEETSMFEGLDFNGGVT